MRWFVSVALLAGSLLVFTPAMPAQDCSAWSNWDLRGTYTMSGSGFTDLSMLVPVLPTGSLPTAWVGAIKLNPNGDGSGWISANVGGMPFKLQLTGVQYAMQADCTIHISFSMLLKEIDMTLGPFARALVLHGTPDALELRGIMMGAAAGAGGDLMTAHRIGMDN